MARLESGTLWDTVVSRTSRATRLSKLQRIPTREEVVEHGGVRFVVRVVKALERKRIARLMQPSDANPFLPYDEDLFVAELSDTHVCILNKFNVVEHHLLIVTREFEPQDCLLTPRDFEAMWICLKEFESLTFYNAGTIAGASQPHKHLQQVSTPIGAGPERIPMDPLFLRVAHAQRCGTVAELPFIHSLGRLVDIAALSPEDAATATADLYRELLRSVSLEHSRGPYNMLATRDWMLLVPRSAEKCRSISVNSLGFAGSLLVRDTDELRLVCELGPMNVLREVAIVA